MFRCFAVAVLLINAYSGSLGASIHSPTNSSLGNDLAALANRCENQFLSSQIQSKVKDCDVPVPPLREKEFQCLIFYDINTQLCDAFAASKLSIAKEQEPRLNEEIQIESFCRGSKNYKLMLKNYSTYKTTAETVFNNQIVCVKACGVDDITNQDTNYYCKYYKWGKELLESSPGVIMSLDDQPAVSNVSPMKVVTPDDQLRNTSGVANAVASDASNTPTQVLQEQDTNEADLEVHVKAGSVEDAGSTKNAKSLRKEQPTPVVKQPGEVNGDTQILEEAEINVGEPPQKSISVGPSNVNIDRPSAAGDTNKDEVKIEEPNSGQDLLAGDKKKQVNEAEDYQDTIGESNEGLTDTQGGDDGEDPILANDLDQNKVDAEQNKKPENKVDTSFNGEKEYVNAIPDGYPDDDDHFFPFFLTVVIIVVALYVLYHNKNRLSKMFFGLIVEGRQSGRRRNSRGHAYRRLDTLEQAMSANTAAPPSKIIY